jgi:hypothetical protein
MGRIEDKVMRLHLPPREAVIDVMVPGKATGLQAGSEVATAQEHLLPVALPAIHHLHWHLLKLLLNLKIAENILSCREHSSSNLMLSVDTQIFTKLGKHDLCAMYT